MSHIELPHSPCRRNGSGHVASRAITSAGSHAATDTARDRQAADALADQHQGDQVAACCIRSHSIRWISMFSCAPAVREPARCGPRLTPTVRNILKILVDKNFSVSNVVLFAIPFLTQLGRSSITTVLIKLTGALPLFSYRGRLII